MLRKVVDRAKQIRRSEGFKHSVATPRRLSLHATQRLNRGVFSIEIQENSGFFSVMQMVLFILMYCDEKCLTPSISARGGLYGDAGENWTGSPRSSNLCTLLRETRSLTR